MRDALDQQGYEQFLPTWEQTTRWSDRIAKVARPLFTGYIFARCVPADVLQVLQVRGVCQVLGTTEPEAIPDEVIAMLRRLAALPDVFSPCAYVVGENVTVACGPYAGIEGTIVQTGGDRHLVVSVDLLGRACRVRIDAADVGTT